MSQGALDTSSRHLFPDAAYAISSGNPLVDTDMAVTMVAWCYPFSYATDIVGRQCALISIEAPSYYRQLALENDLGGNSGIAGTINARLRAGGGDIRCKPETGTLAPGGWSHAGFTVSAACVMQNYFNGALVGNVSSGSFASIPSSHVVLGRDRALALSTESYRGFNGLIAGAAMYNTELSAAEMAALGTGQCTPDLIRKSNLVRYFPGNVITRNGSQFLAEVTHGMHAMLSVSATWTSGVSPPIRAAYWSRGARMEGGY